MDANPDDTERRALVVVDVQRDFCEGGVLAVRGSDDVAAAIATLAQEAEYEVVVATRDWHVAPREQSAGGVTPERDATGPVHCVADTQGARLHDAVEELELDAVFDKGQRAAATSGFDAVEHHTGEPLDGWLGRHGITAIDVVGLDADDGVTSTALDAARIGYATRVLRGAVAGGGSGSAERARDRLVAAGVQVEPGLGDLV